MRYSAQPDACIQQFFRWLRVSHVREFTVSNASFAFFQAGQALLLRRTQRPQ
jgi:hypothetical protein